MKTRQEIFDTVYRHFIIDGNPRSVDAISCKYRGPDGARCAAGLFMTDEIYEEHFEGLGVDELGGDTLDAMGIEEDNVELLLKLQIAHDSWTDAMETKFRAVADNFKLSIPS